MSSKQFSKNDKGMEILIAESIAKEMPDSKIIAAKKFFDSLFDHKRITKLYNTYIEGVETSLANTQNGRMYVNYNIDGAVTGRLSNSGGNTKKGGGKATKIGVSFHTLPREQIDFNIREYVVAPEGYDFITIDMKAMELRVLAHVANEKNMIKAFNSGWDLHDFSTEMTYGKKKENTPKEEWKLIRQICKEVSFLTVYGGTAYTLANKRNIPEAQAQKIINAWMDTFPGVREYFKVIEDYIKQHKYAKTLFGRFRHLLNIDSPVKSIQREAFRQGLNFTVQSPASDILNCGVIGIHQKLKAGKFRTKIAAEVHDSVEFIAPKDETDAVIKMAADELVNCHYMKEHFGFGLRVPLEVEVEVGASFGTGKPYHLTSS